MSEGKEDDIIVTENVRIDDVSIDTSVDAIKMEYYWLISQRDICCSLECNGIIVLDYNRDKMNKRIQELGHCLYDLTYGEEGFKN